MKVCMSDMKKLTNHDMAIKDGMDPTNILTAKFCMLHISCT